jgi:hypothetical protein
MRWVLLVLAFSLAVAAFANGRVTAQLLFDKPQYFLGENILFRPPMLEGRIPRHQGQ